MLETRGHNDAALQGGALCLLKQLKRSPGAGGGEGHGAQVSISRPTMKGTRGSLFADTTL